MSRTRHFNYGYTIVELVVSITVFSIIVVIFGAALTNAYHEVFISKARSQTTTALQTAMDIIEKDVRYSIEFNGATSAPYNDPYGRSNTIVPNYTWSYTGTNPNARTLILSSYASNRRDVSSVRRLVRINKPTTFYNCSLEPEYLPKLQYRTVYFVKDAVLYRRILVDMSSPRCPGQDIAQKQSCPASAFTASKPAICQTRDEAIAKNVQAFTVQYLKDDGTPVEHQYAAGGENYLVEASSVSISLTVAALPSNNTQSTTLLVTRIN